MKSLVAHFDLTLPLDTPVRYSCIYKLLQALGWAVVLY